MLAKRKIPPPHQTLYRLCCLTIGHNHIYTIQVAFLLRVQLFLDLSHVVLNTIKQIYVIYFTFANFFFHI